MIIFNPKHLKKFIQFYYTTNESDLPSRKELAELLQIGESQIRTLLKIFCDCRFIYSSGHGYVIYDTKRNFKQFTEVVKKDKFISYHGSDYVITFDQFELDTLLPNYNIDTLEDLIFVLFYFTINKKTFIQEMSYVRNNEIWFKKNCYSYNNKELLFWCEFTQHNKELNLTNDRA